MSWAVESRSQCCFDTNSGHGESVLLVVISGSTPIASLQFAVAR